MRVFLYREKGGEGRRRRKGKLRSDGLGGRERKEGRKEKRATGQEVGREKE